MLKDCKCSFYKGLSLLKFVVVVLNTTPHKIYTIRYSSLYLEFEITEITLHLVNFYSLTGYERWSDPSFLLLLFHLLPTLIISHFLEESPSHTQPFPISETVSTVHDGHSCINKSLGLLAFEADMHFLKHFFYNPYYLPCHRVKQFWSTQHHYAGKRAPQTF